MFNRTLIAAVAAVGGFAVASLSPNLSERLRAVFITPSGTKHGAAPAPQNSGGNLQGGTGTAREEAKAATIKLASEQVEGAGIELAPVEGGIVARRISVPGSIVPSANNVARIAVKTTGTVIELRKRLGDTVSKDEVVAIVDSREIADAKGEYLAAHAAYDLQQALFQRERELWEKRISAEQQFLRSRAAAEDARVKVASASRKLSFLGLSDAEIAALQREPAARSERLEIRSPISGRIVERRVDPGAAVGRDNLETELYTVVDLADVWVELSVSPGDLPALKQGQQVSVTSSATGGSVDGRIVFIGPTLDRDTRLARVVAEVSNRAGTWHPGSFVTAEIALEARPAAIVVPNDALMSVGGKPTVFVKTSGGFEGREVAVGRANGRSTEILSGVRTGEMIAVKNAFILKAELGKAQAED